MKIINLSEQKKAEGVINNLLTWNLPEGGKDKTYPALEFKSGEVVILFHQVLKSKIAEAMQAGKLKLGDKLLIMQGEKIDDKYYTYQIIINGNEFITAKELEYLEKNRKYVKPEDFINILNKPGETKQ